MPSYSQINMAIILPLQCDQCFDIHTYLTLTLIIIVMILSAYISMFQSRIRALDKREFLGDNKG